MADLLKLEDKVRLIEIMTQFIQTEGERRYLLIMTGLDELLVFLPPIDMTTPQMFNANLVDVCTKKPVLKSTPDPAIFSLLKYVVGLCEGHVDLRDFLNLLITPYLKKDITEIFNQSLEVRLLWMSANPRNEPNLDLNPEQRIIREQFRGARMERKILSSFYTNILLSELRDTISKASAHILHLSGHLLDRGFAFQKEDGETSYITEDSFRNLLRLGEKDHLCIILMCSDSDELVETIVRTTQIPYAIGIRGFRESSLVGYFIAGFYGAIARGLPIPVAFLSGSDEMDLFREKDPDTGELVYPNQTIPHLAIKTR